MKRTLMLSCAALAAMTLLAAPILAKAPVRHAAAASTSADRTCDPSRCSGHCPAHPGAKTAAASAQTVKAQSEGCPISDPSLCPPECPLRASSSAVTQATIL